MQPKSIILFFYGYILFFRRQYGKNKVSKEYTIQDWGVNYDEMEPYYDKAEKMMGVSGEDKSPFSGKRKNSYPNPPLEKTTMLKKI